MGLVVGAVNFSSRLSTMAAPMVAEQPEPLPMLVSAVLCLAAAGASRCLVERTVTDQR